MVAKEKKNPSENPVLPLKWIFCYKESLMDIMICKKDLVLLLFPHRTYVLDIC